MIKSGSDDAWDDYMYWQNQGQKKIVKRINQEDRIIYMVDENTIYIYSCKDYYN